MGELRKKVGGGVFAILLITSLVAGSGVIGLASASTVTKTVDAESVEYVAFDTSGFDAGEFQVKIWVDPAPGGGEKLVYSETHTKAGLNSELPAYRNSKAYDNVTVEISGTPVPSDVPIGPGGDFSRVDWRNKDVLTSSGGDRDFQCGLSERLATAANPAIRYTDCNVLPGTTSVNTTALDANETKLGIYQSAATQADSADNFHTMIKNRLQDTESVALIKGKGAYIRSLNGGEGQTAAEAAATENITEYYSVMEQNLLSEWNSQLSNAEYINSLVDNETGVPRGFVNGSNDGIGASDAYINRSIIKSFGTTTHTLQNGTNVDVATVTIATEWVYTADASDTYSWDNQTFGPTTGDHYTNFNGWGGEKTYQTNETGIRVGAPDTSYEDMEPVDFSRFSNQLGSIDSQTTSTNDQMGTVVNQTYDEYTAGEINSSDLVDPYVLQNQYSPGSEYQAWSAATLATLGTNQPQNLSKVGHMNLTLEDGTQVQGLLQATQNPASGQFEVNQTYNPSNVGPVFVTTDSQVKQISQNFTLTDATTASGEKRANVTIVEKTYETTSSNDLEALNEELGLMRAELEARESALAGGGGGFDLGGLENQTVVIVAVVGGVALLLSRD